MVAQRVQRGLLRDRQRKGRSGWLAIAMVVLLLLVACQAEDGEVAEEQDTDPPETEDSDPEDEPEEADDPVELTDIVIGIPGAASSWIDTYVAVEAGIFEQNGLNVEIVSMQAPQVPAALVSGDVDFTPAIGSSVRASFQGVPVVGVAVIKRGFDYVLLGNGITDVDELPGKQIVTAAPTSTPGVALTAALADLGLVPGQDVEVLNVADTANRVQLIAAGEVDASLINADGGLRLSTENPDLHIIYEPDQFPPNAYTGLVTTEERIEQEPELVKQVISAYLDAAQFILDNPEETQAIYAEVFELTAEDSARLYDMTIGTINPDGRLSDEVLEGEAYINTLTLEEEVPPEQVLGAFSFDLLEEVLAERGL